VTIIRIVDFPFEVPDSGVMLRFEVCGFGLRTGDRRIVIDPWLAFDPKRSEPDAAERWQRISDELRAADLAPEAVDTVVYTHLDGVGWAIGPDDQSPNFPSARHLVPGGEITAFGAGLRGDTEGLNALSALGLVDAIELPHEVAPGVVVEPAPGHTPSNGIVRVQDGDGEVVFVGHTFLHPAQVQLYERAELEPDPQTAIMTRVHVLDEAAARGTVLYGDLWDTPGCGKVTRTGDRYELV